MKKFLTLIIWLIALNTAAQNFYTDSLPKFRYNNLVSLQVRGESSSTGIYYSRNLWSGLGYRNFEELSIGFSIGRYKSWHYYTPLSMAFIDFDIRAQHNIRLSLKRLLYFSFQIGYAPKIAFKEHPSPIFDDYINLGYAAIGIQGLVNRISMGFYIGATATETKQDLLAGMHTYARFWPDAKFKVGISFGERKE
jgi:hypothetical protein